MLESNTNGPVEAQEAQPGLATRPLRKEPTTFALLTFPFRMGFFSSPFGAMAGIVIMLTGNVILRSAGYQGYPSESYVSVVGAIGGAVAFAIIIVYHWFDSVVMFARANPNSNTSTSYPTYALGWILFTILTSTIGAGIMWPYRDAVQQTLGDPLSVPKALAAGMLGATVYLPIAIPGLEYATAAVEMLVTSLFRPCLGGVVGSRK